MTRWASVAEPILAAPLAAREKKSPFFNFRARNPALYHEMVGRHLTEAEEVAAAAGEERQQAAADTDCTLSSIILNHVDLDR